MQTFMLIIHILVCIVLIVVILLQSSKGGGLAGAFGGAGGGAMFGGTGAATFLSKVTRWLAVVFFLTCLGLWYTSRSDDMLPETASQRVGREQRGPTVPAESAPAEEKPADTGR